MTLATPRLILRPFRADDFEDVHAYGSDPDVTRYTSFGPNTPDETRRFLAQCEAESAAEPRLHYNFAISVRETDRVIGGVGLMRLDATHRNAEMGYVLHRGYWGRGYASEAAEALLGFAFGTAELHRVFARCHPDNQASARVMQKAGMQYEGRQREAMWMKGAWWDFLVYSILEREWRARHSLPGAASTHSEEIV